MFRYILPIFMLLSLILPGRIAAQEPVAEYGVEKLARNLAVMGRSIPQELVFVHMDNTGYYVGDTLYFKAYARLSTGQPTHLSELLYVELLDNDGYLVERQNIKLSKGQGHGCFVLPDSLYGGYYELRAYTRWQLNWGRTERTHTQKVTKWFYSHQMRDDFYRDYEKLYSRVFPVYDKPAKPGNYSQNMTTRPMQRYFRNDGYKPQAQVSFYPEGGSMVAGTSCRVAFEASDEDGRHVKGTLTVYDDTGVKVAEAKTLNRGRGVFTLDVKPGTTYKAQFTWKDSNTVEVKLPKPEKEGCSIQAILTDSCIHALLQCAGAPSTDSLAYTVMCNGVCRVYCGLAPAAVHDIDIDTSKLPDGVADITVFDARGRVWADRMVFIRHDGFSGRNVTVSGLSQDGFDPCSKVGLGLTAPVQGTVSVAVRDVSSTANTFDTGNILTEMLLSSQIRGYVEQPDYYFESNDEQHRQALDLLLMVQGWRRYDWRQMAIPGAFAATEPYEKRQIIDGQVCRMPLLDDTRVFLMSQDNSMPDSSDYEYKEYVDEQLGSSNYDRACCEFFSTDFVRKWKGLRLAKVAAMILYYEFGVRKNIMEDYSSYDTQIVNRMVPYLILETDGRKTSAANLTKPVTVHAEFVLDHKVVSGERAAEGNVLTSDRGDFSIQAPGFDGYCRFFCSASDHSKWKNGKEPVWTDDAEYKSDPDGDGGMINYPEFYVRLRQPYPRFVKPYSFYQTAEPEISLQGATGGVSADNVRTLDEVVIGARRSGARRFDFSKPAFVLNAYEAFNETVDAGMCPGYYNGVMNYATNIAHNYIGDMGLDRNYELEIRFNGRNMTSNISQYELSKYEHLHFLDNVYIYTDFAPRRQGDPHYEQSNQPKVVVDVRRNMSGAQYKTYRDRHKVLWGYSVCTDFYNPDYSRKAAPVAGDYRRTLYWNPDLKLGKDGKADISFYNNSLNTKVAVSVEGMTPDGTLLTGYAE